MTRYRKLMELVREMRHLQKLVKFGVLSDKETEEDLFNVERKVDALITEYFNWSETESRPVKILEYKSLLTAPLNYERSKSWWERFFQAF